MTNKQLKNLKDTLWTTADQLRANSGLKSTEYAEPILGLIFLRFADVKYSKYEVEIKAEFDSAKGTRMERPIHEIAIEKCGFYLPEEARYDWLLNLPEGENLAQKVKIAMEDIEKYTSELTDTLPKDIYYSVNSEDDPLVLAKLLKAFKDIPADVELDIFGEIYEYFFGEFALAEGQGGGEFFTPSTVVRYMVEVLAPTEGEPDVISSIKMNQDETLTVRKRNYPKGCSAAHGTCSLFHHNRYIHPCIRRDDGK